MSEEIRGVAQDYFSPKAYRPAEALGDYPGPGRRLPPDEIGSRFGPTRDRPKLTAS